MGHPGNTTIHRGTRFAVDIGGTFTDAVALLPDGSIVSEKVLTTADPAEGFLAGIGLLMTRYGIAGNDVVEVLHATTLGTNLILERGGRDVALLVTEGFRDVLEIGRAVRYRMYDIAMAKPAPLVPRSRIWEVNERISADGTVVRPLDRVRVGAIARAWRRRGIKSAAVAFLHSYAFPEHEILASAILRDVYPDLSVTISSELTNQAREYERTNTALVNAYVAPTLAGYLSRLKAGLDGLGIDAPIEVMQSSGGLASPEIAAKLAVRTLESGPAAGVLMAASVSQRTRSDAISLDMGGTTTKAAPIIGGMPNIVHEMELGRSELRAGSGLPVIIPTCDLVEIGTGGGSIASVEFGTLRVGPRSAGANPGPACYSRGGTEATLTDANLVLGYISAAGLAAGKLPLDTAAAARVLQRLGSQLGINMVDAAWGVHALATLHMEHAIRLVSIDRGLDPRDLALICFGGAGPIHGCRVARSLGIRTVIVPAAPGTGSAVGLLYADQSVELSATQPLRANEPNGPQVMSRVFAELEERAEGLVASLGLRDARLHRAVGARFVGQGDEMQLTLRPGDDSSSIEEAFRARYSALYEAPTDQDVEFVTWYVQLRAARRRNVAIAAFASEEALAIEPRALFMPETGEREIQPIRRSAISAGESVIGPTIIQEPHTAVVLLPGDSAHVADSGELLIEIAQS
ncbi:MAG: hydantoinase/oxoprolinase family protein [Chloroflexota bacterium]